MIPANNIAKNNNGARIRAQNPIILKIFGNTINIKPVPSVIRSVIGIPFVNDMKPRIANTPNAVQISKEEFMKTTSTALSINLEFSGR